MFSDDKLQEKIDGFMKRKTAQFPDLANEAERNHTARDTYKSGRVMHWSFSTNRG